MHHIALHHHRDARLHDVLPQPLNLGLVQAVGGRDHVGKGRGKTVVHLAVDEHTPP